MIKKSGYKMIQKVCFLTVHSADSLRKVDFHFWNEECLKKSIQTKFVTLGFSSVTFLKKRGKNYTPAFNCWEDHGACSHFKWKPLFHPFSLGNNILNIISTPLFGLYPRLAPQSLWDGLAESDIFIVENGAGLLLIPEIKKRFPKSKIIYSVCDRIETLNYHPIILTAEKAALPLIDAIRVPAEIMVQDYPDHPNVRYIPHGLEKELFEREHPNPYNKTKNIISVGDMLFDAKTIEIAAKLFPAYTFHLFGREAYLNRAFDNVISYGEKPFSDIAPYIQHADIGMAPYRSAQNADYLSQSSMKMIQYTYCKLPILAPKFAATGRAHVAGYSPEDAESIKSAIEYAISYDRNHIDRSSVLGWPECVDLMLGSV
ncbi:MAG: hypothetical protein AAF621_04620 [Pseudomonadota bacterium]